MLESRTVMLRGDRRRNRSGSDVIADSKTRHRRRLAVVALAVGAFAANGPRHALAIAPAGWKATAGGNWSTAKNWLEGVPLPGQDVYITTSFLGSQTISFDSSDGFTYASLTIDATGGGTNTFSMSANNLAVTDSEQVGYLGLGIFNQTGGANTVMGTGLYVAANPGTTGFYNLATTASLLASNSYETIGFKGVGNFNQTGGVNTITGGGFLIGGSFGATGTYTLASGASLMASNSYEYIGYFGLGTFNQTGGGNTITNSDLRVGSDSGVTGNYTLSGGTLNANNSSEYIGYAGLGNFNQTGGTNSITGAIYIGYNSGSTGNYTLASGATLIAGSSNEYVGYKGLGNFNQTGGNNTITGAVPLIIGYFSTGTGTYTLGGGSLLATGTNEIVGNSGLGYFNQTGGTNTVSGATLYLGNASGATGNYTLATGAGLIASNSGEVVGYVGVGNINQTGGANAIAAGYLILGYFAGATGSYTLGSGATLLADNSAEYVGYGGLGIFNQTGGANTLTGAANNLTLGFSSGSNGVYTLTGGQVSTSNFYVGGTTNNSHSRGVFNASGSGSFSVASTLQISGTGSVTINGSIASGAFDAVGSLQIATGGLMTLNGSALSINYGSNPSPNTSIRNYISSAYNVNGALWSGTTGITSSDAAANPGHRSIAFADGSDGVVTNLPAGICIAIPGGGVLPAGVELVTTAFPGDSNLDSKVDFADFINLSNHFGTAESNWDHGNFNYDASVNFADFIILSNNFGAGVTGGNGIGALPVELAQYNAMAESFGISRSQMAAWDASIATLPEPTAIGIVGMAGAGLRRRRRSRADLLKSFFKLALEV